MLCLTVFCFTILSYNLLVHQGLYLKYNFIEQRRQLFLQLKLNFSKQAAEVKHATMFLHYP